MSRATSLRSVLGGALGIAALVGMWEGYKAVGPSNGWQVGDTRILPRTSDLAMPHVTTMISRLTEPTVGPTTPPLWRTVVSAGAKSLRIADMSMDTAQHAHTVLWLRSVTAPFNDPAVEALRLDAIAAFPRQTGFLVDWTSDHLPPEALPRGWAEGGNERAILTRALELLDERTPRDDDDAARTRRAIDALRKAWHLPEATSRDEAGEDVR